jgi:hypothetical protein
MSTNETRRHYHELIYRSHGLAPVCTAVAHPCDESSLTGTVQAHHPGQRGGLGLEGADR